MSSIPHPTPPQTLGVVSAKALVRVLLFLLILSSPFVLIEPAPYEGLVVLLAAVCAVLGIGVDRRLTPLLLLLLVWMAGGVIALIPFMDDGDAITHMATTFYLQVSALLFACVFATDTEGRLAALKTAYVLAALVAAMIGILAYFGVLPGAERFLVAGRAAATFKDPNVFGPFLILPLLLLLASILERGVRLRTLAAASILLVALLLSFSRGAWGHFLASAAVMAWLMFVIAETGRLRRRIVGLAIAAALGAVALLTALLSLGAVADMFTERAALVQYYDAGPSGRFGSQRAGIEAILESPLGIGAYEFSRRFGLAPHNVYINTFSAYGWLGGFSYLSLIVVTLTIGFRASLTRTPWQTPLICVFATFVGVAGEGVLIDTDHWRHFYLLLGLVWGLTVATERHRLHGVARAAPPPYRPPSSPPRPRYRSLPG